MESLSALQTVCEGNPQVAGGFPQQKASYVPFGVFLNVTLNKKFEQTLELPVISDAIKHIVTSL